MQVNVKFVLYGDMILGALSPAALERLENNHEWLEFRVRLMQEARNLGYVIGWTAGFAESCVKRTLDVLEARGLTVSADQRHKILSCRDRQQLSNWLHRAKSAASLTELFAEMSNGGAASIAGRGRVAASDTARTALDMIPEDYHYNSPLVRESVESARVEGQVGCLFDVFEGRGMVVPEGMRRKVLVCRDEQLLALWLRRAVTVASPEELFSLST